MHAHITFNQLQSQQLSPLDLSQAHPDLFVLTSDSTISIDQIRDLKLSLHLAPFESIKVIYFPYADQLTLPAQNALLKSLEEPPPQVVFILETNHLDRLLPTIQSRCQIYSAMTAKQSTKSSLSAPNEELINRLTDQLDNGRSVSSRLTFASNYTKKEAAVDLVTQLTNHYRQQLHQKPTTNLTQNLKLLHQTKVYLDANTNPALTIENLFFHLKT